MSTDAVVTALTIGVVGTFATLVAVHVSAVFGLFRLRRVKAAFAGLVLPPRAAWLAWRHGMRGRAIALCVIAPLYVTALTLSATRVVPFDG
jgi:hypothetical protein